MEAAAKDYNLRLNYVSTVKLWSVTAELEMAAQGDGIRSRWIDFADVRK